MVGLVLASIVALLLTSIILWSQRNDEEQLDRNRPSSPALGIQIICGDCAGDGERPLKTFADSFGRCEGCGGDSYVLASVFYARRAVLESGGRVLKFDKKAVLKAARSEKIAV